MDRLHLEGPLHAWNETALAGTIGEGAQARPVMVFLGPESTGTHSTEHDYELSEPWIGRTGDHVVPLLDVVAHGGRNAWIHPRVEALGLVHLVDVLDGERPHLRVAAEIVGALADALHALGPAAYEHPGPTPEDVAIDAEGAIHLLGFVTPYPPSPVTRDPSHGTPAEALVWRLGMLLAHLLSGRVPAVSDTAAHQGMLRRVLIRSMSREGPLFTERYRDWLTGMLSWEPGQRPTLSSIGPGLRKVGKDLGGPDLKTWAATQVPRRMLGATHDGPLPALEETESSFQPWNEREASEEFSIHPADLSGQRTLPGVPLSAFGKDDPTAESTIQSTLSAVGSPRVEPGTMPVEIGPPAEAMQNRPSLPVGFLELPEPDPLPVDTRTSPAVFAQIALFGILGMVIGSLILLGILVLIANP